MEEDRKISSSALLAKKSGGGKVLTLEAEQTSYLQVTNYIYVGNYLCMCACKYLHIKVKYLTMFVCVDM